MGGNITSFFLLAFRKVVHPPLQDRSLRSSDFFFFCRHHLDWISLRHSVLIKSSVLRLALASMRTGQPEAGHPRNLYRVGRASSSPAQATGWRHDGWRARPARLHGSRSRSVPTRCNQARRSAGGGNGLFEVPGRYARFHTDRKSISHLSPGPRRFAHAFGKCNWMQLQLDGGRLSPKQVLTAHLIWTQSAEPLLGYRNAACTCACAEVS